MAYIAIHEGENKGAFEVPYQTDAYCRECGERMRVWRESTDGRARHFKHVSEMSGTGDSSEGGCSGGEGDKHRKWKNFAAERLSEVFDDAAEIGVEQRLAAPHTDKMYRDADAIVMFEERDPQLGLGLAVEVQHKNRDKNIKNTTRDYIKQDIAVAWLEQEDFASDGCRMDEVDFRDRASDGVSPLFLNSTAVPWYLHLESHVEAILHTVRYAREELNRDDCDHDLTPRSANVPATLPPEWNDERAKEIWEDQYWHNLFRSIPSKKYIDQVKFTNFSTDTDKYEPPNREVPARLPDEWFAKKSKEIWKQQKWKSVFRPSKVPEYILRASIPKLRRNKSFEVKFTPQIIKELTYKNSDWADLFADAPLLNSGSTEPTAPVKINFTPFFNKSFWREAYVRGVEMKYEHRDDLQKPFGPFDDVQCHVCGKYVWWKDAAETCSCGSEYDWVWNVKTNRVPSEKVPKGVTD